MDDFLLVRSGPYPGAQGAASVAALKQGNTKAFARRTETFPTETDAKQFAKQMLSEEHLMEKHHIVAGYVTGRLSPGTSYYLRFATP